VPEDEAEDFEEEDTGEELMLDCPACGEVQPHEVLRAAAAGWTVECEECRNVRTLPAPRKQRFVTVPVILSQGAAARTSKVAVPLDGPVRPDDEFELDGHRIRVTAVETAEGRRPKSAPGRDVKTLYAVMFDTVAVNYTLNEGETTRAFREEVVPEEEIHIGRVREVQGVRLVVKTLKSDQNRTLQRGFLLARNVRRAFADRAPSKSKPGQKARVRHRGPPPGVKGEPRNRVKRPGPGRPRRG
jgi:uncharacterized Zn finger protein